MEKDNAVIAALAKAVQSVLETAAGLEVSAKLKRDPSSEVTGAVLQVNWGDHAASTIVRADSDGAEIADYLATAILDKMGGGKMSLQGEAPARRGTPDHGRPIRCDGCGILMLCGMPTPDGVRCGQCCPGDERAENYLKLIWREEPGMPSGKLRHGLYFAGAKRVLVDPDGEGGFNVYVGAAYTHCANLEEAKADAETQVRCDAELPPVPGAEAANGQ